MDFYWEIDRGELRRRTSIGDLGAANVLAVRLLDEGFTTERVLTTIAQLISHPVPVSVPEAYWAEIDENYIFVGSYA